MKISKKTIKSICWVCNGKGCKACHRTGKWNESIFYFIVKDKNGKQYCYDADNLA